MEIVDSLLLVPLITGPIFILAGMAMKIFPPKKINAFYGYRTPNSMENQEKWDFAQKYSAKKLIEYGAILLSTSILGYFLDPKDDNTIYIGLGLMIVMVVILFFRVERAIKQQFSEDN